jgi:Fe-Mn family superoxide dismutase
MFIGLVGNSLPGGKLPGPPLYPEYGTRCEPKPKEVAMVHVLKPLPYSYNTLEPHYDTETLSLHHGKHHQAYVDNLNKLLKKHPALEVTALDDLLKNLREVPDSIREKVKNNAGGVWNHDFFWACMRPATSGNPDAKTGGKPAGALARKIDAAFGDFETFKTQFKESALEQFGSGWTWLLLTDDDDLAIANSSNQDCPISQDRVPLLALDVWEHAYYLKFQNRRADWIDAWWNVVDWNAVAQRM